MPETCELFDPACARTLEVQVATVCGDGGWALMHQAGAAAWAHVQRHWPQARRLLVLCGPGNNGGDALVLATLALQAGCVVQVLTAPGMASKSALARKAQAGFEQAGGTLGIFAGGLPPADLVIDGLLGLWLSRPVDGAMADLIDAVNASGLPVLALDVPSGVDAATGAVAGVAIRADRTVMFLLPQMGLHTGPALDHVGVREMAPLVLPQGIERPRKGVARCLHVSDLSAFLSPRRANAHKGDNGHVLVVGGNHGTGGAVALCGESALRSGAGLVTVATRVVHVPALLARTPELMSRALDDVAPDPGTALAAASVLAIGPGLGQDDWARALFAQALGFGGTRVLDADALNLLAADPRPLPGAILTPHPGEAARLLGITVADIQRDRVAALGALVQRYKCVVVLKGAGSLVGAPGEQPCVINAGNPGMAVGGMGDLLTGVIAALVAQGHAPLQAARIGTLLHAGAGDHAAGHHRRGMMPTDLLPHLRVLANAEIL